MVCADCVCDLGWGGGYSISHPIQTISLAITSEEGVGSRSTSSTGSSVLRTVKVARLLRLAIALARVQQSRERQRRLKMVGMGTPVDKVFEICVGFKERAGVAPEDKRAFGWIMDLIAKEELYKVAHHASAKSIGVEGSTSVDMSELIRPVAREGGLSVVAEGKGGGGGKEGQMRRGSRTHVVQAPEWVQRSLGEKMVMRALAKAESWDFDVFTLGEATGMHPLVIGGVHIMESMGVLDKLGVSRDRLASP